MCQVGLCARLVSTMFSNYKRNFFISLVIILFLIITDSSLERTLQQSIYSLLGINAEAGVLGSQTSLVGWLDSLRLLSYGWVLDLENYLSSSLASTTGIMSTVYSILGIVIYLLKLLVGNLYAFYAFLAVGVYLLLTSRLFRNHYNY